MISMLQRFFAKLVNSAQSEEIMGRANLIEDVLYGKATLQDSEVVRLVAELTTSLCNQKVEASIDAGSFVFFKIKNQNGIFQIFHKRLNVRERIMINARPTLLTDPYKLLSELEKAIALDFDLAEKLRLLCKS